LDDGDVQQLEAFVENNGFIVQPNEFTGQKIATELAAGGSSATWQALYQGSEVGNFIPVPYFDFKATDPTKVQAAIASYSSVLAGSTPPSQLVDMSDVFSDTAQRPMTPKPPPRLRGPPNPPPGRPPSPP